MNLKFKISLCFILLTLTSILQAETPSNSSSDTNIQNIAQSQSEPKSKSRRKPYYVIEVVLFRHLNEQGKKEEYWYRPDPISETSLSESSRLNTITDDIPALAQYDMQNKHLSPLRNGIAALSPSRYKLSDSAAHLRHSSNYQLLAHFGWTQQPLSKKRALPILLAANEFSDNLVPSGALKLYVSRFLHLQVDLSASLCEYQTETVSVEPNDKELDVQLEKGNSQLETQPSVNVNYAAINEQENTGQCVNNTYRFKQKRKMRSKELHYLDNPIFGMLVYITPLY